MKKYQDLDLAGIKNLSIALAKKYAKKDVVIGLIGPLGAGKTTFVKDFAKYYGIKKIKSPTFIIGSVHQINSKLFYHYDFYRLADEKQLTPLGFTEIINSKKRIILIEWVDKFPKIKNKCDLILNFEISSKNTRNVTIS
jgi:tRNA threonylcarbamoyladenosine biosynthesis protein TsaE